MVAQAVLNLRKQPNALVPPSLIVGPEGTEFAKLHGIPTVSNSSLVTASSLKSYRKSLALVNRAYSQSSPSDTVGVICLSPDLMTSATSSSGGPLLKLPGRVGAAATFGAASWADVVHDGSGNVMKAIAIR